LALETEPAVVHAREAGAEPGSRLVAKPFWVIPISRCQTAHLVPAAYVCVRGVSGDAPRWARLAISL